MQKPEIAKRLARRTGRSEPEAADELDRVVHRILRALRGGASARLPGVGVFRPDGTFCFERGRGREER